MSIWYISFVDEKINVFLGAIQTKAPCIEGALEKIKLINPGGQMAIWELSDDAPIPEKWFGRLLSKEDLIAQGIEVAGNPELCSTKDQEVIDSVDYFISSEHNLIDKD